MLAVHICVTARAKSRAKAFKASIAKSKSMVLKTRNKTVSLSLEMQETTGDAVGMTSVTLDSVRLSDLLQWL